MVHDAAGAGAAGWHVGERPRLDLRPRVSRDEQQHELRELQPAVHRDERRRHPDHRKSRRQRGLHLGRRATGVRPVILDRLRPKPRWTTVPGRRVAGEGREVHATNDAIDRRRSWARPNNRAPTRSVVSAGGRSKPCAGSMTTPSTRTAPVPTGNAPQVMAARRNLAITALRLTGITAIAAA